MKLEKGTISFGKTNINFSVKRSKRRKTVSIFVDPFEGVFLRAPLRVSLNLLSKLVHSKAIWILDKQRRINEAIGYLPKREFVTGESFLYLGRQLRLKVLKSKNKLNPYNTRDTKKLDSRFHGNDIFGARVAVKGGRFLVSINSNNNDSDRMKIIREILSHWYKRHARKVLVNRVKVYSKKLRVFIPEIILANQTKRWGSCNRKGRIRFNWHIIMAPMSLVDYVVAHEICHLKHINHSENFWKLLGRIMPDYEARRERLCKEGPRYYF
ncbi:MAG: M48 family metallopeptidase [Nitrospirae bacterium]|nr:M48 family metallopeptidase [Nitrospirota bacterium]